MARSIGLITSGLALIGAGAILLLHEQARVPWSAFAYLAPLVIVAFGVEVVWHAARGVRARANGWSIALVVLAALVTVGTYVVDAAPGLALARSYGEPVQGSILASGRIHTLVVRVVNTTVTVTGTGRPRVTYSGVLPITATSPTDAARLLPADWSVQVVAGTLSLTLEPPASVSWLNVSGPAPVDAHLTVAVPPSVRVRVTTSNAAVRVAQLRTAASVVTSNGSVSLDDLQGGATAETSNATVVLDDLAGPVDAVTSNGAVIGRSPIGGNWSVSTSNASVRLVIADHASALVSAATSDGGIGGNIAWHHLGAGQAAATLGSGTYRVKLATSNGNVTVRAAARA